jgi:hypothetical protein
MQYVLEMFFASLFVAGMIGFFIFRGWYDLATTKKKRRPSLRWLFLTLGCAGIGLGGWWIVRLG